MLGVMIVFTESDNGGLSLGCSLAYNPRILICGM